MPSGSTFRGQRFVAGFISVGFFLLFALSLRYSIQLLSEARDVVEEVVARAPVEPAPQQIADSAAAGMRTAHEALRLPLDRAKEELARLKADLRNRREVEEGQKAFLDATKARRDRIEEDKAAERARIERLGFALDGAGRVVRRSDA